MGETYYLLKSGTLSKSSNSLILKNETENFEIPLEAVDTLMIFGNVTFTTPALSLLSEKNIPAILFSERGWYITSLIPENYLQSGIVLAKQVEHQVDYGKRMYIAKKIVIGAAKNMRKVTARLGTEKSPLMEKQINSTNSIQELMGIEGNIHIRYLEILDTKLLGKFKINSRTRRPPGNYSNSMMSYLYSVLYGVVGAEIFGTHLSPSVSYLHELSERRSSLALDIAEIFRPIFCDRTILKLINLGIMGEGDFVNDGGVFMNERGKRKVLQEFDKKMQETTYVSSLNRKVSNRRLIRLELYKLERHILGDSEYKAYVSRV
ncbi:CRISPR-associated endonuclease Cas1 [Thermoplasmatales archaeon]|nr:CRISPR-associated endonuclease Cas1 [Thermoplasmatales archaeon]